MKPLNDFQIKEVLDEFCQLNNIDITLNEELKTKDIFYKVMIEETNVNKNIQEQRDLITSILLKFREGWSESQIFNYHSDNKHLNYFNLVMGDEKAKIMLEKLEENKIPTSIFRGLKLNTPDEHTFIFIDEETGLSKTVNVQQTFISTENESLELDDFIITVNGEEIFNFKESVNEKVGEQENDSAYDNYINVKNVSQMENDISRKIKILYNRKKEGKGKTYKVEKGKSTVLEHINTINDNHPNGIDLEVILSHTGKQIYKARDKATGRFIKYRRW